MQNYLPTDNDLLEEDITDQYYLHPENDLFVTKIRNEVLIQ